MVIYKLTKDELFHEEIGRYTSYGIIGIESGTNRTVVSIPDVFTQEALGRKYINLFNEEQLDVVHLRNVIDDILETV